MKILFTGGSSFTGYWFIKELASEGHDVVAVFRRNPDDYTDDLRRKRIDALSGMCRQVFCTSFGDDKFLGLIKEQVRTCSAVTAPRSQITTNLSSMP